jgi:hypothetical protein
VLLGDAPTSRRGRQAVLAIWKRLEADFFGIGFCEDIRRANKCPLALGEEAGTHRTDLMQRNHNLSVGTNTGTADIPKKPDFAAVDIVAVAGELPHGNRMPLGRPGQAAIIRVAKHIVTERIHTLESTAILGLHLAHIVRIEIVETINPPSRRHECHGVGVLRRPDRLQLHRRTPGFPLVGRAQRKNPLG